MTEYTYEDIIMDPEDPRLEGAIGKEVYFGNVPSYCLRDANENNNVGILRKIGNNDDSPFCVKGPENFILNFEHIIIKKKDSDNGYIPFRNAREFLEACLRKKEKFAIIMRSGQLSQLDGIQLNQKDSGVKFVTTDIWDEGIAILSKKLTIKGMSILKYTTTWEGLLENFTFLDGSPCGKEVK